MAIRLKTRLRDKTRQLLKNRPATVDYRDIEEATGLKQSWLKAFACKGIENPDVNKIETLYEYLTQKELIK